MNLSNPENRFWRMPSAKLTLPIYDPNSIKGKMESEKERLGSKRNLYVALITITILAFVIINRCISYSVNVETEDGRAAVHLMDMLKSPPVTERLVDHTVLAATATQNAWIPLMIKTPKNIRNENPPAQSAYESGTLVPSSLQSD